MREGEGKRNEKGGKGVNGRVKKRGVEGEGEGRGGKKGGRGRKEQGKDWEAGRNNRTDKDKEKGKEGGGRKGGGGTLTLRKRYE